VGDQAAIDEIFSRLDTEASGRALLTQHGLDFDQPHFSAATTTSGARIRRRLTVSLCGDARGSKPMHRIALFGYDDEGRRALENAGLRTRPAYRGSRGGRFESAHADFGNLVEVIERIEEAVDVSVRFTARLGVQDAPSTKANSLPFVRASAVRPGMVVVTGTGEFDVVERVEPVELDAPVYDLHVERT